jgi:WbqC-like protein family
MRVAIVQPAYLPWLGYFDIIDSVDTFVFLDTVQLRHRHWHHRNRIKTPHGLQWLTVPVVAKDSRQQWILHTRIADGEFWRKHLRAIEVNYRKAPYFEAYIRDLSSMYAHGWERLVDLNSRLTEWLLRVLAITTPVFYSSSLGVDGRREELLARICEKLGATEYLSGITAASYLLPDDAMQAFTTRNARVVFHNYAHPQYRQLHGEFIPYVSVLDLILNAGPASLEIIQSGRRPFLAAHEIADSECRVAPQAARREDWGVAECKRS